MSESEREREEREKEIGEWVQIQWGWSRAERNLERDNKNEVFFVFGLVLLDAPVWIYKTGSLILNRLQLETALDRPI